MTNHSVFTRRRFIQGAGIAGLGLAAYGAHRWSGHSSNAKGKIVVVGGGAAGLDVAARLHRWLAQPDITVIDPAPIHFYQPGYTMIAAGVFTPGEIQRHQASLIPNGVRLIPEGVVSIEAEKNQLCTASNKVVDYDYLVLTPGLEIHWDAIEGISRERLGEGNVHCIYDFMGAQRCWQAIERLSTTGGRAYFTDTWTKLKCGGAPKKINMIAEDYCRRHGTRDRVDFQFYTASEHMYSVQPYRKRLEEIYKERSIPVTMNHRIKSVDTHARRVTFEKCAAAPSAGAGAAETPVEVVTRDFDFLHIVPPMSAPRFVTESSLAFDEALGKNADWVPADKNTLIHKRFKNVFVAGDVAGLPTSKTAAAVRKQAPVLAANLIATMEGRRPEASYDGYSACPFVTEYGKVLMAEYNYEKKPTPSFPLLDPGREHRAGWVLKRYILKPMYFELMLRGMV